MPTNYFLCYEYNLRFAYVNIFIDQYEQKYVYPLISDQSILFLRYIDDIFMVWVKSEKQLKDVMKKLNQKHPPIKFDYKFDCKQIEFLDTLVYINQQKKLQTFLFWKIKWPSKPFQCKIGTSVLIKQNYPLQLRVWTSASMYHIPKLPQSL